MANFKGSSPFYFPQRSSFAAAVRPSRSFLFVLFLLAGILAARWLALAIESTLANHIAKEEIRLHIEWLAPPPGGGPATPQK